MIEHEKSMVLNAIESIERQLKERWDQADKDHSECIMASVKDELSGRCRAYQVACAIVLNEKRKHIKSDSSAPSDSH